MGHSNFILRIVSGFGLLLVTCCGVRAERLALVIGNDDYTHLPKLQKAVGDAQVIKGVLEGLNFRVTIVQNANRERFGEALDAFEEQISNGDEVVVHYSGHGVAIGGRNYLLPVDTIEPEPGQERRVQRASYEANDVIEMVRARKPKFIFAVLDACRNNPFQGVGRSISLTRGLARMDAASGEFILFSAGSGETALDRLANDDRSETSVFTRVLVKHLQTPGLTLQAIARATQRQVRDLAMTINHTQFPDYVDRTTEDLILLPGTPASKPGTVIAKPDPRPLARPDDGSAQIQADTALRLALLDGSDAALREVIRAYPTHPKSKEALTLLEARADDAAFAKAREADTRDSYEAYQKAHPTGDHMHEAQTRIASLASPPVPTPPSPAPVADLPILQHRDYVASVAYTPDGSTLVTGGGYISTNDFTVKLWDTRTAQLVRSLEGHTDQVSAVACAPDGQTLASASYDHSVKLWDAKSGQLLRSFPGSTGILGSFTSVTFSPDGRTLAAGSKDKTVKLWDLRSGQLLRTLEGHRHFVWAVAYSPDGRTIASGSEDGTVKIWNARSGRIIRTLDGHSSIVGSVAYSPDGRTLVSGSYDNTVVMWDAATGRQIRTLSGKSKSVTEVAFSPDGRTLVAGSDQAVMMWDATSGRLIRTLEGHGSHVTSVAYSPDGRTLASGSLDKTARVWDGTAENR